MAKKHNKGYISEEATYWGRRDQDIDFTGILWQLLGMINRTRKYTREYEEMVESLYDLMLPYQDDEYKDNIDKIQKDIFDGSQIKGGTPSKNAVQKKRSSQHNQFIRRKYQELVKLLHRNNFIPSKGIVDYDEYDDEDIPVE